MIILEPEMTEENVTIDTLVERADSFAKQLKTVLQDDYRMSGMIDSARAFFSGEHGVDYVVADTGSFSNPRLMLANGKSILDCINSEWLINFEGGASLVTFHFGFYPFDSYRFSVEVESEHSTVFAYMNTHDITNSDAAETPFFEFNLRKGGGFGDAVHPRQTALYNIRIPGVEYAKEYRKAIDYVAEKYGWNVDEIKPFQALKMLDHFANTILGFDVLVH